MTRKLLALGFMAIGVAALSYAAQAEGRRLIGIVGAMAAFFAAASLISRVGALAVRLRPFIGKTVSVRVWGSSLPRGEAFEVVSVRAISAGLHIYLRSTGSSTIHLKIAQPREAQVTGSTIQIADAKYLQWAGSKLETTGDCSAPALVMEARN